LALWPNIPSQKSKFFIRGSGTIGTSGFGFCATTAPTAWSLGPNPTESDLYYSHSSYSGTEIQNVAHSGAVIGLSTNTPYSPTDFVGEGLESRLVTAGLRARYTGTELNRSGIAVSLCEPHHHTLLSRSIEELMAFDAGVSQSVDRKWVTASFQPNRTSEVNYAIDGRTNTANGIIPMAICFTGVPGETFEFEYTEHWELIGYSARGKTNNPNLQTETYSVLNAFSQIPSYRFKEVSNGVLSALAFYQRYRQHAAGGRQNLLMY